MSQLHPELASLLSIDQKAKVQGSSSEDSIMRVLTDKSINSYGYGFSNKGKYASD